MMPKLLSYIERSDHPECHAQLVELADNDDTEHVLETIELIKTDIVQKCFTDYIKTEVQKVNFAFWWTYIELVTILLMFTRSLRDGCWELYLQAFSKMLPFFMRYGNLNYARWVQYS